MGAVAGEPHSPVERGKAKAENRKKKSMVVLSSVTLHHWATTLAPVSSWTLEGHKLLEVTTVCVMYLIWKAKNNDLSSRPDI